MTGMDGCISEESLSRFQAPAVYSNGRFTLGIHGRIANVSALYARLLDGGTPCGVATENIVPQTTLQDEADKFFCLWQHHGLACLPELDGAFAFALWDSYELTLTLVRDRFGLKPLYYASQQNGMAFGSSAARLVPHSPRPNLHAIFHYLTVQSVPAPLSGFQGVKQLPHAHSLVWRCGHEPLVRRYWAPVFTHSFGGTLDEASATLHNLLATAIQQSHEVSRAGVLLSGGVDSSLMVALLCEAGHSPVTFSMGFSEQAFDERPFARAVARQYNTTHHELDCSGNLPSLVDRVVSGFAEPFADSSALPTWLTLHAVREAGLDAALLGDGGDDLFGGYERHLNPFLYSDEDTEDGRAAQLRAEFAAQPQYAPAFAAMNAASAKYYSHWARFWGPLKRDICGEALRDVPGLPPSLLLAQTVFQQTEARNLLDAIQTFELDYYLPCTLASKVEVPARLCGLHTIAPFLCNAVGNFALQLPQPFRVGKCEAVGGYGHHLETKRVVKRLAEHFLPHKLVYRRKMGFGVPLASWLRGPLRELLCDTLLGRDCIERGWLEQGTVRRLIDEHLNGVRDWHYPLWALLMLELWAKKFLDEFHQGVPSV